MHCWQAVQQFVDSGRRSSCLSRHNCFSSALVSSSWFVRRCERSILHARRQLRSAKRSTKMFPSLKTAPNCNTVATQPSHQVTSTERIQISRLTPRSVSTRPKCSSKRPHRVGTSPARPSPSMPHPQSCLPTSRTQKHTRTYTPTRISHQKA
jgi:hypothetical protein